MEGLKFIICYLFLVLFISCEKEKDTKANLSSYTKMKLALAVENPADEGFVNLLKFRLAPEISKNHLTGFAMDCNTNKEKLGIFYTTRRGEFDPRSGKMVKEDLEIFNIKNIDLYDFDKSNLKDNKSEFRRIGFLIDVFKAENKNRSDSLALRFQINNRMSFEDEIKFYFSIPKSSRGTIGIRKYQADNIPQNKYFNLFDSTWDGHHKILFSTFVLALYNPEDYDEIYELIDGDRFKRTASVSDIALVVDETGLVRYDHLIGYAFGEDGRGDFE